MDRLSFPNVVLAAHTPGDCRAMLEAISKNPVRVHVAVVRDGGALLYLLDHCGRSARFDPPLVHLILLDIHLPPVGARHLVRALKINTSTWDVPLLLVGGRRGDDELELALGYGAEGWLPTPLPPEQLEREFRVAGEWWLRRLGHEARVGHVGRREQRR